MGPSTPKSHSTRTSLSLPSSLFSSPFRPSPSSAELEKRHQQHHHQHQHQHTDSHSSSPTLTGSSTPPFSSSSRSSSHDSVSGTLDGDADLEAGPSTPLLPTPSQEKAEYFSQSLDARKAKGGSRARTGRRGNQEGLLHRLWLAASSLGLGRYNAGSRAARLVVLTVVGLVILGCVTGGLGPSGSIERYSPAAGGEDGGEPNVPSGLSRFRPSFSLPSSYGSSWSSSFGYGSESNARPGSGSGAGAGDELTYHTSSIYTRPSNEGRRIIDVASDPLPFGATLEERLRAWEEAPGGRGEVRGEVELGGFVQWNQEACPVAAEENNPHMITHHGSFWARQNRSSIYTARSELITYMRQTVIAHDLAGPAHWGEGRGIVMIAGNADTLQRVIWSVGMLRSYGSKLPVQVYHFPSEAPSPDSPLLPRLAELGVTLHAAPGTERSAGTTKSYHLKALAVVLCPFREVLYLDSDSVPARDPEYMFDSPNYKEFGVWLAPDYWKTSAASPMWAILGVRCRDEWETEAGQIFIDKSRHLDSMLLAKHMLENYQFWYKFSDGDKDIFRHSLLALRKRWAIPGRYLGAGALPSGTLSGEFCAHTMMQHDSWGAPLFVHYNLLKQIPSGVGRGYSWGRTKQLPLFEGEGERKMWVEGEGTGTREEQQSGQKRNPVLSALMGDDESTITATAEAAAGARGLGELGADDLADADDYGMTRSQRMPGSTRQEVGRWMAGEVKQEVTRRAARERGWKTRYHGGVVSALCLDVDWNDPRSSATKEADEARRALLSEHRTQREASWDTLVSSARERAQAHNAQIESQDSDAQGQRQADQGLRMSEEPTGVEKEKWENKWAWVKEEEQAEERRPDWGQSPVEVVWWRDDEHLRDFENRIYDLGFVPSGPGF